jgi:hypothetical protein
MLLHPRYGLRQQFVIESESRSRWVELPISVAPRIEFHAFGVKLITRRARLSVVSVAFGVCAADARQNVDETRWTRNETTFVGFRIESLGRVGARIRGPHERIALVTEQIQLGKPRSMLSGLSGSTRERRA